MKLKFTLVLFAYLLAKNILAQPCNTPVSLPYYQNFEGVIPPTLPPCTINQTIYPYGSNHKWETIQYLPPVGKVLTIYVQDQTYNNTHWFYLPMMFFDASKSYKLSYKYNAGNSNPTTSQVLGVYFGTCPINTCMTNLISTGVITSSNFISTTKMVSPPVSGNYYIGFNHIDRFGYPGNSTDLDSIVVEINDPLPVKLSALSYKSNDGITKLFWQTYTEQNNQEFEIQQSANGIQFQAIGHVPSKASNGNSQSILPYEFTVSQNLLAQGKFYRLKQIDKDGKSSYSNIANPGNLKSYSRKVIINGNPINEFLSITVLSSQTQRVQIKITDQSGRLVYKNAAQLNNGENNLRENIQTLGNGMYYLSIIDQIGNLLQSPSVFIKQ